MPELPEMQALSERIDDALRGATLAAIQAIAFSGLKTVSPAPESLIGRALAHAGRRGKFLILDFAGPRVLVHLSQGGRLDLERPAKTTRPKIGVVRFRFENAPALFVKEFGHERKAGWWVLAPGEDGPLERLGPEPGSPEFAELFRTGTDARRIHTLLRDQRTVAGIGRGYSDEILHRARLSPYASLASLNPGARATLVEAIDVVLAEALANERERKGGLPTKLGERFAIHGQHGHPCPRCGDDLRRISYESHDVTYCPACQTGGRALADRRMSRLIK